MRRQGRTHATACCPDEPEGTILPEAIMHRNRGATRERVCVVLRGPQLVPSSSSGVFHFGISKFLLNFSQQLRKAPRNPLVNH